MMVSFWVIAISASLLSACSKPEADYLVSGSSDYVVSGDSYWTNDWKRAQAETTFEVLVPKWLPGSNWKFMLNGLTRETQASSQEFRQGGDRVFANYFGYSSIGEDRIQTWRIQMGQDDLATVYVDTERAFDVYVIIQEVEGIPVNIEPSRSFQSGRLYSFECDHIWTSLSTDGLSQPDVFRIIRSMVTGRC